MSDYPMNRIITEAEGGTYAQRTAGHVKTASGIWVPAAGADDGSAKVQVTGSKAVIYSGADLSVSSGSFIDIPLDTAKLTKINIFIFRYGAPSVPRKIEILYTFSSLLYAVDITNKEISGKDMSISGVGNFIFEHKPLTASASVRLHNTTTDATLIRQVRIVGE